MTSRSFPATTPGLAALSGLAVLATTLALAACEPSAPAPEGGDAGHALDAGARAGLDALADAYCPAMAAAYCARVEACGCAAIAGYPADCAARYEASCRGSLERYRAPVERGEALVRLDGVAACVETLTRFAEGCLAVPSDVEAARCAVLSRPEGAPALGGEGEACGGERACGEGLRCAERSCRRGAAAGAACRDALDCEAELDCLEGRCAELDVSSAGSACATTEACAPGLGCLASAARACRPTAVGDACREESDCASGMVCVIEAEGEPGRCALAPSSGAPCFDEVTCAPGLACVEGLCAAEPGLGEPCAMGPLGPVVCAEGLACVARVCSAPPTEGETCALGVPHCADGLGCVFEGADNVCRARRGEGGTCDGDEVCLDGLYCDVHRRTCAPALAAGEPCRDGNECGREGACVLDASATLRCAPRPREGEPCLLDECRDGLACRRVAERGSCAPAYCTAFLF